MRTRYSCAGATRIPPPSLLSRSVRSVRSHAPATVTASSFIFEMVCGASRCLHSKHRVSTAAQQSLWRSRGTKTQRKSGSACSSPPPCSSKSHAATISAGDCHIFQTVTPFPLFAICKLHVPPCSHWIVPGLPCAALMDCGGRFTSMSAGVPSVYCYFSVVFIAFMVLMCLQLGSW